MSRSQDVMKLTAFGLLTIALAIAYVGCTYRMQRPPPAPLPPHTRIELRPAELVDATVHSRYAPQVHSLIVVPSAQQGGPSPSITDIERQLLLRGVRVVSSEVTARLEARPSNTVVAEGSQVA